MRQLATISIEGLMAVVKGVTVMGAGIYTGAASDAEFIVVENFRFEADAFRVVTPPAIQGNWPHW